ncbi:MAG: hypothetical protein U0800_19090 [Isosphaeraceae bacterium]
MNFFTRSMLGRSTRELGRKAPRNARKPSVDGLPTRLLMAADLLPAAAPAQVSAVLQDGVLRVRGTDGDDRVAIAPLRYDANTLLVFQAKGGYDQNGNFQWSPVTIVYGSFSVADVRSISVTLAKGNDTFTGLGLRTPELSHISGGRHDDNLAVFDSQNVSLEGDAGDDLLYAANCQTIQLLGGAGNDLMAVLQADSSVSTQAVVNGGDGEDFTELLNTRDVTIRRFVGDQPDHILFEGSVSNTQILTAPDPDNPNPTSTGPEFFLYSDSPSSIRNLTWNGTRVRRDWSYGSGNDWVAKLQSTFRV